MFAIKLILIGKDEVFVRSERAMVFVFRTLATYPELEQSDSPPPLGKRTSTTPEVNLESEDCVGGRLS